MVGEEMASYVARGFEAVKMKTGLGFSFEEREVAKYGVD